MHDLPLPDGWRSVERPPSLFCRFGFDSYAQTRAFLDRLAALSAETCCYPDLGFGKTYVNVTLPTTDGIGPEVLDFARRTSALATSATN